MKVYEIINKIEAFCPKSLSYEWDNPGLQTGDTENDVKKVYLTLDVTNETLDEALKNECDMIISHHPLIFSGIKKIDYSLPSGQLLKKLIKNDITVYTAHTNMDRAEYGLNFELAKRCGIKNPYFINEENLGMMGKTDKIKLSEYAKSVSEKLHTPVKIYGADDKIITKSAVCSGAGADIAFEAIKAGADVLVTGDVKYHIALDCLQSGFALIDAGHFGTEWFVTEIFENILKNCDIEIFKSTIKENVNYFLN